MFILHVLSRLQLVYSQLRKNNVCQLPALYCPAMATLYAAESQIRWTAFSHPQYVNSSIQKVSLRKQIMCLNYFWTNRAQEKNARVTFPGSFRFW